MELIAIRHSKVTNCAGQCYGDKEVDLCETAFHEAIEDLNTLKSTLKQSYIFSSPRLRCQRLASELCEQSIFCTSRDLKEMSFGSWEGQLWNQIPRHEIDAWSKDIFGYTPPLGENFNQVCSRILNFIEQHLHLERCVVITHAGIIKGLYHLFDEDPDAPLKKIEFASCHSWQFDPKSLSEKVKIKACRR